MNGKKSFTIAGVTYVWETVKCGKRTCTKCPHGPYWFAYYRAGVMLRKIYVGKSLPELIASLRPADAE